MSIVKIKTILISSLICSAMLASNDLLANPVLKRDYEEVKKDNEVLRHGQYVFVTLKDGSQSVAKIVGRKNAKKYYVNQIGGSLKGLVHVKYLKKMTKEEVLAYRKSKDDMTNS